MAESSSLKRNADDSNGDSSVPNKKKAPSWSQGLLASMHDPDLQIFKDDKVIIIKDKYPKAKYHFLVMPRIGIPSLKSLNKEHLDLLKHVEEKGREIADKANKDLRFRLGYHAVPSMSHLHMHVISQDFNSECLKTKKHWNSFTTEYFVDSTDIIQMLESNGKVSLDASDFKEVLKRNLRCHVCSKSFSTLPALKTHIQIHNYSRKASK